MSTRHQYDGIPPSVNEEFLAESGQTEGGCHDRTHERAHQHGRHNIHPAQGNRRQATSDGLEMARDDNTLTLGEAYERSLGAPECDVTRVHQPWLLPSSGDWTRRSADVDY